MAVRRVIDEPTEPTYDQAVISQLMRSLGIPSRRAERIGRRAVEHATTIGALD